MGILSASAKDYKIAKMKYKLISTQNAVDIVIKNINVAREPDFISYNIHAWINLNLKNEPYLVLKGFDGNKFLLKANVREDKNVE